MGIERQAAIEDAVRRMEWEGAPIQEKVVVKNSRFPERAGRIRFDTALELVTTADLERSDWSLFNSAREMDDVSDR